MSQLIRYGVVGLASNISIYLVYLTIVGFGVDPKISMTAVYLLGATIGFFANRRWTFTHGGNKINAAMRFSIAHGIGYLLNLVMLFIFVDLLKFPHQFVQIIAIIVVAGYLFLCFRHFVFPASRAI